MMWSNNWVQPDKALCIFDTRQQKWQHMRPTGRLPPPEFCCGMCVVEERAYALVNHPNVDPDGHMDVYVLDLQACHGTRLPAQDDAPPCLIDITPVVVQVSMQAAHRPSALTIALNSLSCDPIQVKLMLKVV